MARVVVLDPWTDIVNVGWGKNIGILKICTRREPESGNTGSVTPHGSSNMILSDGATIHKAEWDGVSIALLGSAQNLISRNIVQIPGAGPHWIPFESHPGSWISQRSLGLSEPDGNWFASQAIFIATWIALFNSLYGGDPHYRYEITESSGGNDDWVWFDQAIVFEVNGGGPEQVTEETKDDCSLYLINLANIAAGEVIEQSAPIDSAKVTLTAYNPRKTTALTYHRVIGIDGFATNFSVTSSSDPIKTVTKSFSPGLKILKSGNLA